ncbi:unnamed protein product [Parascedosporium putredinis]|uniref:Nephrocystin 3-like N-terminal domain-containing protein n=1 Tax=Parascedosporium putredinis TaxID=1442378 RepID=A0A9P1H5V6_9PEZI|nr:unnamed protein product [Parascedosporium putredinis]CAI7996863.1 unnamed protein product [Parascedosporium putredinis]
MLQLMSRHRRRNPRPDDGYDIRLGDIAVSYPNETAGGVFQYDLVKAMDGGKCKRIGFLRPPPLVLLKAIREIKSIHELGDSKVPYFLREMLEKEPKMGKISKKSPGYVHQGLENDHLFKAEYKHITGPNCRGCESAGKVERDARDTTDPEIHYGIIASGNTLVKDAAVRDRIAADFGEGCICFEMEAAGLMNHFPCLVIRGICDYADSHKNDQWQRYASATAAAYAKELLEHVPVAETYATILDRLNKDNDRLICSFFFDFGDKRQQTVDGMLRSLAFQLHKCEADFVDLSNLFQAHQNGRDQPTIKALKDVVYKMLKSQKKKTSIVMDALDESETRDDLVQWMKDVIFTPELDHVQLIYTNRPEPEFVRDIPSLIGEENRLALDKQSINIDIRS